ncbi:N-acetylglucosamine-6-sulfatase-like [Teleopsis dalmanni]|uniref:N-acetylglucosamine-6-sulfatase-like n=1 Tax=Teleopsis dalmanni TaxID=139649 RepID=UPI0018CCA6A9|nr:N-acetylglucosamine-6-sulfatase-like [Teleopsis dalmanni]
MSNCDISFHCLLLIFLPICAALTPAEKPNILLVLTDDQDVALGGMMPMKQVQALLGKEGATFNNAFTSSPLCCPSRASLLSGKYAHNHRTTNNSLSGGCNGNYWLKNVEPHALPVLLQTAGYHTFFAGKYLNEYRGEKVPPGWNDFHGLHGNSKYYNYTLRENAQNVSYTNTYLTDLLSSRTLEFLGKPELVSAPFFAMVATPAPHAPFIPAERHRNSFANIEAPRTPNFNHISESLEKHWLVGSSKLIPTKTLKLMDTYFQQRWETLLAVDELVATVWKLLADQKKLDNTYIIFTSDNGYHIGQFAQPFDKRQPYDTDIRIPLLMSGPTIPKGIEINAPAVLVDLVPTILEWAQLSDQTNGDGESLHALLVNAVGYDALLDKQYTRSLLVQHWGEGNVDTYNAECPWSKKDRLTECTIEGACHCQDAWNNTYACIRHFSYNTNRLYCEFRDNENFVEGYDVDDDPFQMTNMGYEWLPIERALYSLALQNLTKCAGPSCRDVHI